MLLLLRAVAPVLARELLVVHRPRELATVALVRVELVQAPGQVLAVFPVQLARVERQQPVVPLP